MKKIPPLPSRLKPSIQHTLNNRWPNDRRAKSYLYFDKQTNGKSKGKSICVSNVFFVKIKKIAHKNN